MAPLLTESGRRLAQRTAGDLHQDNDPKSTNYGRSMLDAAIKNGPAKDGRQEGPGSCSTLRSNQVRRTRYNANLSVEFFGARKIFNSRPISSRVDRGAATEAPSTGPGRSPENSVRGANGGFGTILMMDCAARKTASCASGPVGSPRPPSRPGWGGRLDRHRLHNENRTGPQARFVLRRADTAHWSRTSGGGGALAVCWLKQPPRNQGSERAGERLVSSPPQETKRTPGRSQKPVAESTNDYLNLNQQVLGEIRWKVGSRRGSEPAPL